MEKAADREIEARLKIKDFYKKRLEYFMCNIGKRTEYYTLITPTLVKVTLKRFLMLGGKLEDV